MAGQFARFVLRIKDWLSSRLFKTAVVRKKPGGPRQETGPADGTEKRPASLTGRFNQQYWL